MPHPDNIVSLRGVKPIPTSHLERILQNRDPYGNIYNNDPSPPQPMVVSDVFGWNRLWTTDEVLFAFFLGGFVGSLLVVTAAYVWSWFL
jgi:hypothetical protein